MSQGDHVKALLDLVASYRKTRCGEIQSAAGAQAQELLRHSRRAARARVHEAFAIERSRAAEEVALAEARLRTRSRLHAQRNRAALLREGWQLLIQELTRRWDDAGSRQSWVDAIIIRAREVLPGGAWRIAHAPGWPAGEQKRVAAQLDPPPAFSAGESVSAGLRVACGNNVVDGTISGLTAERDVVGARLLHHLEGSTT